MYKNRLFVGIGKLFLLTLYFLFARRLNDSQWPNIGEYGGPWSKDAKGLIPSYFSQDKSIDIQNNSMRGSSSAATTIMNNNSQDLYAEVSDVTMTSGLLSTFHTQPSLQHQFNGDPEPYATTTLAMQNTNARLLVCFKASFQLLIIVII